MFVSANIVRNTLAIKGEWLEMLRREAAVRSLKDRHQEFTDVISEIVLCWQYIVLYCPMLAMSTSKTWKHHVTCRKASWKQIKKWHYRKLGVNG